MTLSRRKFILQTSAATVAALALWQLQRAAQAAPDPAVRFQPTWDSLAQYQCPDWYRDAKFGIWAHWSAQCVPEQGDWYARSMYEEGSANYKYHVAHYGHPSKVGFKEIEHLWHAEHWDPAGLMALYKAAGAKYFVALAQHHDNLDCFDSKYQPWNSVALGPKKDIVGGWAKAARAAGLRFGVSSHGSHTWNWLEVAQGADKEGPLKGVPYDGKLTKADGKGTWWEGMNPQALYAQDHKPQTPVGSLEWGWENKGHGELPDKAYQEKFYNRTIDLLDKYHPDFIYFDDTILPLYEVDPSIGLRIAAHHYNTSMTRHGGRLEAVLTGKGLNTDQQRCLVNDFERGQSETIPPHPWQTDTCIGEWHYKRSIYENHQYKTPDQVVKTLLDVVSKNGNLLLSIPVRGDGSIDSDERAFLTAMGAWMGVNGEAIYGTRPWTLFGEGQVRVGGGGFNEAVHPFSAKDFRFTTRGNTLYASALGWPEDGKLTVRTLAAGASGVVGDVTRVSLLGSPASLAWERTAAGLVVTLPAEKPCDHAYALKIEGLNVAASRPVAPPPPAIHASADGVLTLTPAEAVLHGTVHTEDGAVPNLGFWADAADTVSWNVHFDAPGTYAVSATASALLGASALALDAGQGSVALLAVPKTSDWGDYQSVTGTLKIAAPGDRILTARPADPAAWHATNLRAVTLRRTGE